MKVLIVLILSLLPGLAQAQGLFPSSRFQITTQDTNGFIFGRITDTQDWLEGYFYNQHNQWYGAYIQVGSRFHFGGVVGYHRMLRTSVVDYSQELALFKKRVGRFSIEPTLQQTTQIILVQNEDQTREILSLAQPSSFGIFVRTQDRKGRNFGAGISTGPGIFFTPFSSNPAPTSVVGRVNFRLTVVF